MEEKNKSSQRIRRKLQEKRTSKFFSKSNVLRKMEG